MRYRYQYRGQIYELNLERQPGGGFRAQIDGKTFDLEVIDVQPGEITVRCQGRSLTLYWARDGNQRWVSMDGCTYLLERPTLHAAGDAGLASGENAIRSPMPAQVRQVLVTQGEWVQDGQTLLLVEAMKMEIRLQAPQAGRITRLLVAEGDTVEKDQLLVELESAGA